MGSEPGTTWLLFDRECRICSAAAAWARALAWHGRLRTRPIQESRELLGAMPPEDVFGAVHAVAPDGRIRTGAAALPLIFAALSAGPGLERLLEASPPAMTTLARAYRVLAAIRARLTCGIGAPAWAARSPR